jgi:hypothetical protein
MSRSGSPRCEIAIWMPPTMTDSEAMNTMMKLTWPWIHRAGVFSAMFGLGM